jgi:hypothetical protein
MKKPFPNFLIIGAQKSGTTSLHKYLEPQSEIFMSAPLKEPGLFWGSKPALQHWRKKGKDINSLDQLLQEYMLKGYSGEKYFGEASTFYTISNYSRRWGIPERIHSQQPDMKFIYVLRNPFDRIISNYLHHLKNIGQDKSLSAFIDGPRGRASVLTSLYFYQLEEYLKIFSPDKFKILIFEELIENPYKNLKQVFEFLGLESDIHETWHKSHNVSGNRSELSSDELKFTREQFERLSLDIIPDLENLFDFIGRKITDWDLSSSKWCH